MHTIKWLERRPHLLKNIEGRCIPTEALQVTKKVTLDTRENRFLKFMLIKIIEKIDSFIRTYTTTPWKKNEDIVNKLSAMKKSINSKLKTSFLKDVESDYRNTSISLVFNMASGYREGIFVSLKKGVTSTLVYENPKTKETFKVYYNSFKSSNLGSKTEGSKTISQKPDNLLSIDKLGSEKAYEFVFDAKYKIDISMDYQERYGGIVPKEEDINTMHRYRDAIVYKNRKTEAYNNSVFGAEHFAPPLLLNVDSVYSKIRNLKYRYLTENTLFPTEITQKVKW